jgi:hypothetical protein
MRLLQRTPTVSVPATGLAGIQQTVPNLESKR